MGEGGNSNREAAEADKRAREAEGVGGKLLQKPGETYALSLDMRV